MGFALAFDRANVRTYDKDGYLHVLSSTITSAQVNPYLGREIMQVDPSLQLDPERRYMLLRDPAALEAGLASMHGKPLLFIHKGVTADDHDKEITVGTVMNPVWEAPDIKAELVVWPSEASQAIETETKRDLSAGYRYRPVMEPGTYNGTAYDGRMVDIDFNHVALVETGRVAGAIVGDEQIRERPMVFDAERSELDARFGHLLKGRADAGTHLPRRGALSEAEWSERVADWFTDPTRSTLAKMFPDSPSRRIEQFR